MYFYALEFEISVLFWKIRLQVSAYQSGVSLVVDKSDVTVVTLLLQSVTSQDGGIYECRPDNAPSATIRLHVLKGNEPQIGIGNLGIGRLKPIHNLDGWVVSIINHTKIKIICANLNCGAVYYEIIFIEPFMSQKYLLHHHCYKLFNKID